jgi:APA family basic amino acid/polyamine antiporter
MSFEYGLSSALNAVGFMHTLKVAFNEVGFEIPDYLISTDIWKDVISINPAATIMIVLLILLMLRGIKESITVNNIFTVGIMLFYQYANLLSIAIFDSSKAQPFFRNGEIGVMRGAAVAFFGYTSFEQPITVAEEAINPQRDLPKSLTRQIMIETVQYSVLAYLVSGFINIDKIDPSNENT